MARSLVLALGLALAGVVNLPRADEAQASVSPLAVVDVAAGEQHSVAVLADGTVWTWGLSGNGQLGRVVTVEDYWLPRRAEGATGRIAAAGNAFSLVYDGDALWGAGYNSDGYLGWGPSGDEPVFVSRPFPGVAALDAWGGHVIALLADSTVLTWGEGRSGQLGIGTTPATSQAEPVPVPDLDRVVEVAAGGAFNLVRRADGSVWGWGQNTYATLGTPDAPSRPAPDGSGVAATSAAALAFHSTVPVPSRIDDAISVAAGDRHALAVRRDGTVWGWGSNTGSALGLKDEEAVVVEPRRIEGLAGAVAVAAGSGYSLALMADGTVRMWGRVSGAASYDAPYDQPHTVPGLQGVVALDAANAHAFAVTSTGELWAWGSNDQGQIGSEQADVGQYPPVRVDLPY